MYKLIEYSSGVVLMLYSIKDFSMQPLDGPDCYIYKEVYKHCLLSLREHLPRNIKSVPQHQRQLLLSGVKRDLQLVMKIGMRLQSKETVTSVLPRRRYI